MDKFSARRKAACKAYMLNKAGEDCVCKLQHIEANIYKSCPDANGPRVFSTGTNKAALTSTFLYL